LYPANQGGGHDNEKDIQSSAAMLGVAPERVSNFLSETVFD